MTFEIKPEREWLSKCEVVQGNMEDIAKRINEINCNDGMFVIATHPPSRVDAGATYYYETIVFFKVRK